VSFPEARLSDIDTAPAPHDAEGNAPPHDPSKQSAHARAQEPQLTRDGTVARSYYDEGEVVVASATQLYYRPDQLGYARHRLLATGGPLEMASKRGGIYDHNIDKLASDTYADGIVRH
jgi:hypothetical protein